MGIITATAADIQAGDCISARNGHGAVSKTALAVTLEGSTVTVTFRLGAIEYQASDVVEFWRD